MPNWCCNKIRIRAKKTTLEAIKEAVKGVDYTRPFIVEERRNGDMTPVDCIFCFHSIIPQPDEILDPEDPRRKTKMSSDEILERLSDKSDKVMPEWWSWRVNNWGTKWAVSSDNTNFIEKKGSITYCFDTAWAPPEPVISELSYKFPDAEILLSFYEPGCIGRGSMTFKGGEVIKATGAGLE